MLDSLVRVSRRVGWDPTSTLRSGPPRFGAAPFRRANGEKKTTPPGRRQVTTGRYCWETPRSSTRHPRRLTTKLA